MKKIIRILHYISFSKYPILLISIYFCYKPILQSDTDFFKNLNIGLIFLGVGLSLDSLKDYKKLNWLDKKVLHNPKIAKYYFLYIGIITLGFILIGIFCYLKPDNQLNEISIGLIVMGIGMLGFLKSGIETTKDYMEKNNI